jgi:hypothetical protein
LDVPVPAVPPAPPVPIVPPDAVAFDDIAELLPLVGSTTEIKKLL